MDSFWDFNGTWSESLYFLLIFSFTIYLVYTVKLIVGTSRYLWENLGLQACRSLLLFWTWQLTLWQKRWVEVEAFDRSRFKLFTLIFSNKSVQAPSCEGPKTAQRSLFLSFEINYCFQITELSELCRAAAHFSHNTLPWNNGIVILPMFEKTERIASLSWIFSNNATIPIDIWSVGKKLIAMFESPRG